MTNLLIDWQAPIPLGEFILPEWPNDTFPEEVQRFVSELASSTETPLELSSLTTLSGISAAVQGKYVVQVKPDYCEPVNVWTAVALPPGCRKTAVQKAVTEPLACWEEVKKRELEPIIAKMRSENESLEVRIKEKRRKAANADDEEYQIIKNEVIALESQLKIVPGVPQTWTGDVTPENLGTLMSENDECMAVLSDEAGIFDILGGRYSSGIPNLDLFLQGHSGSPVRVNRGSRAPVFLSRPALTMGLTPQPEVLRGLTKNPSFRGRGLLGRFLFAIPTSNLGMRSLEAESMQAATKTAYFETITHILGHPRNEDGPYQLKLSARAFEEWRLYALAIEVKMADDGPFVHLRDWAGKLPGAIVRIAGLLHIVRYAKSSPSSQEISEADMRAAIKIGHKLGEHALAAFELMGADRALDGARAILKWIEKNRWESFTFRDCQYAHKSRFKNAEEVGLSIKVLEERHYIYEIPQERKAHRPSRLIVVNPFIYQEAS
jgi:hypothetical protein